MKFDTPATTNPIDQLKVVGKPTDRIDGPLKTTGTAPYAYERHDVVAEPGLRLRRRRRRSPRAASRRWTSTRRKAAPGVLAIVTAENAGKLGKGKFNTAKLLGGPEIEHYHQAVALVVAETFEQARAAAAAGPGRLRAEPRARSTSRRAKDCAPIKPSRRSPAARPNGGRRLRRRLRRGAGQARRDLHHARPGARDDGAARLDRGLGRRQADGLDLEPDDRLGQRRDLAKTLGIPKENVRLDLALHRRRLRRQAVPARRRACWPRSARAPPDGR